MLISIFHHTKCLQASDVNVRSIFTLQSLVAARNMVVQRLRAITDERRRLMAALHSFVLQVGTTQQIDHACNDSAAISGCVHSPRTGLLGSHDAKLSGIVCMCVHVI